MSRTFDSNRINDREMYSQRVSMPRLSCYLAQLVLPTWTIDAARGVFLRGACWAELWPSAAALPIIAWGSLAAGAALSKWRVA
jgi:hypothetical protein